MKRSAHRLNLQNSDSTSTDNNSDNTISAQQTLQQVAVTMRLLQQLELSANLTARNKNKLYWMRLTLIDVVHHVNESAHG